MGEGRAMELENGKEYVPCNLCNTNDTEPMFKIGSFNIVRCKKCGFCYTNPRIHSRRIKQVYSKAYFEQKPITGLGVYSILRRISRYLAKYMQRCYFRKLLNRIVVRKKRGKILDIGCATGTFLEIARANGWETYGVEISEFASNSGRKKFDSNIFTGTVKEASYRDRFFDVVTMVDVFSHLFDPVGDFLEINRILHDDGIFVFVTGNRDLVPTSLLKDHLWGNPEEHMYLLNNSSLRILLEKTGFELIEAVPRGLMHISPRKLNTVGIPNKLLLLLIQQPPFLLSTELMFICTKTGLADSTYTGG